MKRWPRFLNCLSHPNSLPRSGSSSLHHPDRPTLAQCNRFNLWALDFTRYAACLFEHTHKACSWRHLFDMREKAKNYSTKAQPSNKWKERKKSTFIFCGLPCEKLQRKKHVVKYLMFTRNITENVCFDALQTWGIMNIYLHKIGKCKMS